MQKTGPVGSFFVYTKKFRLTARFLQSLANRKSRLRCDFAKLQEVFIKKAPLQKILFPR